MTLVLPRMTSLWLTLSLFLTCWFQTTQAFLPLSSLLAAQGLSFSGSNTQAPTLEHGSNVPSSTSSSLYGFPFGGGLPKDTDMKRAAEQIAKLKPEDIDTMIQQLDSMGGMSTAAMKGMGMDVETMKQTLRLMKENPKMLENAKHVMNTMTPEQMMEQSKMAQEQLKNLSPEQLEKLKTNMAGKGFSQGTISDALDNLAGKAKTASTTSSPKAKKKVKQGAAATDAQVVQKDPRTLAMDAMFATAQLFSEGNDWKAPKHPVLHVDTVTLSGFLALPVVQLLLGESQESDLSVKEVVECWEAGSMGAPKVDRAGFERVWAELQEYFEDDLLDVVRDEAKRKSQVYMELAATQQEEQEEEEEPESQEEETEGAVAETETKA
eukprot:Nitzschia sp. Nitz4//scaffold220_size35126//20429//21779//NITZ4_007833-RA/size35126-processed-gene-0.18-mRNA-1//-1//CDS//3329542538//6692//frame0